MSSLPALLLAASAAAAFAVATRPNAWGAIAWLGALLLHEAVRRSDSRTTAALASALAASGACSVVVTGFAPLHPIGSVIAAVGIASTFSVVGAVAYRSRAGSGRMGRRRHRVAQATLIVGLWCGVEAAWARPWLAGPFTVPILSVGSALADGPVRTIARWGGTLGLTACLLGVGALASMFLPEPRTRRTPDAQRSGVGPPRPVRRAVRIAAATLLLAGATAASLPRGEVDAAPGETPAPNGADGRTLRLRLVQHVPTPQGVAAAGFDASEHQRWYAPLFDALHDSDGHLVVWPEASWPRPIALDAAQDLRGPRVDPASGVLDAIPSDVSLLFGAGTVVGGEVRNSVLLARHGQLARVADKVRLVPWTESGLEAGAPGTVVPWNGVVLAAAICWDAVFPSVARAAARAGADVLVYLANDAYAGRGPVGPLHLRQARLRAVETSLPVVFVQATGPSAVIDPNGRLVAVLPEGARGHLDVDLPVATSRTFQRGGDR